MKIAFFEVGVEEAVYFRDRLTGHEIDFYAERIDKHNLPVKRDYDAISIFTNCEIKEEVVNALPNLKFITTRSTGYNHIDINVTTAKNIIVSSVPSYGEYTVAEFTFGLILTLSRKIFQAFDRIKETGSFDTKGLQGIDLRGKTIGVVGTGRIGKNVIKIARGFEMNVLATDAYPDEKFAVENQVQYVPLETLFSSSHVITFHVPESVGTFHMINMKNINLIKKGAIVINTARGSVIETAALVKALHDGIIGGAGLDVLEEEVLTKDERDILMQGKTKEYNLETILYNHVLVDMDNVIITPHNAFNTKEALLRILDTTILNINSFAVNTPQNEIKIK